MTELASAVCMNQNNIYKEQSIGIPLPLVNVKVVDVESKNELPFGKEGELLVSSPGIMLGYLNKEKENEEVLERDSDGVLWMHTGDLARIDEDGFIFITGRLKRIYMTKDYKGYAYKIFPNRMEQIIEKCDVVKSCAVIIVEDEVRLHAPVVYVESNPNIEIERLNDMIKQWIKNELPEYYEALSINCVEKLPLTSNQKIDYKFLERLYLEKNSD